MNTRKERHRRRFAAGLLMIALACTLAGCGVRTKTISFTEHLDDTVLQLDGQDYPLRALAFYIAYEEEIVQEQALLYDASDPNKYWNAHINGHFVRVRAAQEAMNLAIHDFIFYQLATEAGMELTDEEIEYADSKAQDFWDDLGESGQAGIGISLEELTDDLRDMALAQKYQELYAAMEDVPSEDCDVDGLTYEQLLSEHSYKIIDSVWDAIPMGSVTLD